MPCNVIVSMSLMGRFRCQPGVSGGLASEGLTVFGVAFQGPWRGVERTASKATEDHVAILSARGPT